MMQIFPPQNCQRGSSSGPTASLGIRPCGPPCLCLSFRSLASVWGRCWSSDPARGAKCCRGSLEILMGRFSPIFCAWWMSSPGNSRLLFTGTLIGLKRGPCKIIDSLLRCCGRLAKKPPLGVFLGRSLILCRKEWEESTPSQIWCNRSTCRKFSSTGQSTLRLRDTAAGSSVTQKETVLLLLIARPRRSHCWRGRAAILLELFQHKVKKEWLCCQSGSVKRAWSSSRHQLSLRSGDALRLNCNMHQLAWCDGLREAFLGFSGSSCSS